MKLEVGICATCRHHRRDWTLCAHPEARETAFWDGVPDPCPGWLAREGAAR